MKFNLFLFTALFCAFIPLSTHAQEFIGLVGIPELTNPTGEGGLNQYINALYRLSISIAALLAVIKIVAAGAKYMLTDIVPAKEDAKKDIQGALIGLLIVIGAIVILNTVNSDLTNLDLTIPVQPITQGEQIERAIYDAVTAACDRPDRAGSCRYLECENLIGVNRFDILDDENETTACRRTCREDYGGAFSANLVSPRSATCFYDPSIAQRCDVNNSWNCCEEINNGTWYSGHNRCYTEANPFDEIPCDLTTTGQSGGRATFESDCTAQIASCLASGNTVISSRESTILCTDNEQAAENVEEAAELDENITNCRAGGQYWFSQLNYCGQAPIQSNIIYTALFTDTQGESITIRPNGINNFTGRADEVIATYADGRTSFLTCNQVRPAICETN